MIPVRHAQRGKAPGVVEVGIQRKAVFFLRQRSAVREDLDGAREVMGDGVLEFFAPARRIRRQAATSGEIDRGHIKARVETPAAVEADSLRIEFVEIVEDAADSESFVVVQLFIENTERNSTGVEHEILADEAAGVGEAIRELL